MENFGRFNLIHRIAIGGMAEVYLACPKDHPGQKLVIKRILPHLVEDTHFIGMFLNEARIAAQLNHPNVVSIFDLGKEANYFFISMEYIHGEDLGALRQAAKNKGRLLDVPLVLKIISDVCLGLQYTHAKTDLNGHPLHLVHRDISPQNIMVTFQGGVKILDFGVARAANQSSNTLTGEIKGKYAYLAPEQARGLELDARADIFSLGIVLYELLTGTNPLKRDNELMTLRAAMDCDIPPPSYYAPLLPGVEAVVLKAVQKNRDERYANAEEFRRALLSISGKAAPASPQRVATLMQAMFYHRSCQENPDGSDKFTDFDAPSQEDLESEVGFLAFPKVPHPKSLPEFQALTGEWDLMDDSSDMLLISENTQTNSVSQVPAIRSAKITQAPKPRVAPAAPVAPAPVLPSLIPAPAAHEPSRGAVLRDSSDKNPARALNLNESAATGGRSLKPMPAMGPTLGVPTSETAPRSSPLPFASERQRHTKDTLARATVVDGAIPTEALSDTSVATDISDNSLASRLPSASSNEENTLSGVTTPSSETALNAPREASTLLDTDLSAALDVLAQENLHERSGRKTLLVNAEEIEKILQEKQDSALPVRGSKKALNVGDDGAGDEDQILDVSESQICDLEELNPTTPPPANGTPTPIHWAPSVAEELPTLSCNTSAPTVAEIPETPLPPLGHLKRRGKTSRPVSALRGKKETASPRQEDALDELTGTATAPGRRSTNQRQSLLKKSQSHTSREDYPAKKRVSSSKLRAFHASNAPGEDLDEPTQTMPGSHEGQDRDNVSLNLLPEDEEQVFLNDAQFLGQKSMSSRRHSTRHSRANPPPAAVHDPSDPNAFSWKDTWDTLKDRCQRCHLWLDKLYDDADSLRKQHGLSWEVVLVSFVGLLFLILIMAFILLS